MIMPHDVRHHTILHDLFLRQYGIINPRRAMCMLMRRMFTRGSHLRFVGQESFKGGHFVLDDMTIVGRREDSDSKGLEVYSLRHAEVDNSISKTLHQLPRAGRAVNRFTTTIPYNNSGYPFRDDIPPEDYRPALFVLTRSVLSRYDCQTHRLISQHNLSFTGVSFAECDIDYEADWLIIKSVQRKRSSNSVHTEGINGNLVPDRIPENISRSNRGQDAAGKAIIYTLFVVFKMHPFKLQRCFTLSNHNFPNAKDKARYGTLMSVDYSGTFLILRTSRFYSLFYDFGEFVNKECSGQQIIPMVPGPVLLAVPASSRMVSAGGLGNHSLLIGDMVEDMQLSSMEKLVCLTARMMDAGEEGEGSHNNRRFKQRSRETRALWRRECGPRLLDLLNERSSRDYDYLSTSVHFFAENFNRIVISEQFDLRILELPSNEDNEDLSSLACEMLTLSGRINPESRQCEEVTSPGQRVQQPHRSGNVPEDSSEGNKHFTYTIAYDYNLVVVLGMEVIEYRPTKMQNLFFYDIFTLKLLQTIPIDLMLFCEESLFDIRTVLLLQEDTVIVVVHGSYSHDVFYFKLRCRIPPGNRAQRKGIIWKLRPT